MSRPDPSSWQTALVRLTAFPSPIAQIDGSDWWRELTGEEPEKRTTQPKTGIMTDEGAFQNGTLTLVIQQDRIDWILSASEEFQTLEPFPETLGRFHPPMERWLGIPPPPLQRLAFGAVLLLPVENKEAGYLALATLLPSVQVDPEGSTDLLYQINRPRDCSSEIDGLRINRLSKWSVSLLQDTRFLIGPAKVGTLMARQRFFCNLALDVNTAAEYSGELPANRLSQLLNEFLALASEIVTEGDIR